MACEKESFDVLIVADADDVPIIVRREEGFNAVGLIVTDFQRERAAGREAAGGIGNEARDEDDPIGPAVEREGRVVHDFAGERGELSSGNVGKVRRDQVKRAGDEGKKIGHDELHALRKTVPSGNAVSPRATIAWVRCGQARALLAGREFVTVEDLLDVAPEVLRHRLWISPPEIRDRLRALGGPR